MSTENGKLDLASINFDQLDDGELTAGVDQGSDAGDEGDSAAKTKPDPQNQDTTSTDADQGEGDEGGDEGEGSQDEPTGIYSELNQMLGYEVETKDLPTDVEGLVKYIGQVGEKVAEEKVTKFLEEDPELKEAWEWRKSGRSLKELYAQEEVASWSEVTLDEKDSETQKQTISALLQSLNYNEEEIKETILAYEDSGRLHKQATIALSKLQKQETDIRTQRIAQEAEYRQKAEEETKNYWEGVKKTLEGATKLKEYTVQAKDKDPFFAYISKPVKEGRSQYQIDLAAAGEEDRLTLAYLFYKKFDLNKHIQNAATTQRAKQVEEIFRNQGDRRIGGSSKTYSKGAIKDLQNASPSDFF